MHALAEDDLAQELAQEVAFTLMTLELEHGTLPYDLTVWGRGDSHMFLERHLAQQTVGHVTRKSLDALPPVCEGLARRGVEKGAINLVPETWKAARQTRRFRRQMVGALVAVLGVWLLGMGGVMGGVYYQKMTLDSLQDALTRLSGPALEVNDLRHRVVTVERYADTSHSALECLREVSEMQPAGVDLTSFSYTKGETLKLVGEATDNGLIYEFKDRLDGSKLFAGVTLGSQSQNRSRNKWTFDMDLKLPKEKE
jgi:hypothetical protein